MQSQKKPVDDAKYKSPFFEVQSIISSTFPYFVFIYRETRFEVEQKENDKSLCKI